MEILKGKSFGQIGILGGTFDPVHWGHLKTASSAADELNLDLLAFLPAFHPPHKHKTQTTSFELRTRMLQLCLHIDTRFTLWLIEAEQDLPGTTLETIRKLREMGYTENKGHLIWLMGSDSLLDFGLWRQPQEILNNIEVAVLPRPGYPVENAESRFLKQMRILDTPMIDLAAQNIRRKGQSLLDAVPQSVADFIKDHNLYGYHIKT